MLPLDNGILGTKSVKKHELMNAFVVIRSHSSACRCFSAGVLDVVELPYPDAYSMYGLVPATVMHAKVRLLPAHFSTSGGDKAYTHHPSPTRRK